MQTVTFVGEYCERQTVKNSESLIQLIPDIFYDALAYFLPASLLFIGVVTVSSPARDFTVSSYLSLSDTFDKLIVVVLGLGVLYTLGQFLTFVSYEIIHRPMRAFASWRKDRRYPPSDQMWTPDYTYIRHTDAALGLEVTKRYARTILTRNNALVSLLILVISIISNQDIAIIVSAILFPLLLYETYGRRVFFYQFIVSVANELRGASSSTQLSDMTRGSIPHTLVSEGKHPAPRSKSRTSGRSKVKKAGKSK